MRHARDRARGRWENRRSSISSQTPDHPSFYAQAHPSRRRRVTYDVSDRIRGEFPPEIARNWQSMSHQSCIKLRYIFREEQKIHTRGRGKMTLVTNHSFG